MFLLLSISIEIIVCKCSQIFNSLEKKIFVKIVRIGSDTLKLRESFREINIYLVASREGKEFSPRSTAFDTSKVFVNG